MRPPRLARACRGDYVAAMGAFTMARGAALGLAVALCASGVAQARAADLAVAVDNVKSARGHVRVDVCTEATFLGDCAHSGEAVAVPGRTVVYVYGVPPGDYAIQAYQDENDDHEVNRNHFGIPTEGFGFSHDASFSVGPPKFRHAHFTVDEHGASVRVKLHYLPH